MARPRRERGRTRRLVESGLSRGLSRAEIAARHGISRPTVTYHAKQLGHDRDARFSARHDWSAIRQAYEGGLSVQRCKDRFGFSSAAWSAAVARGDVVPRPREMPIEDLLVIGRATNRVHLKGRLIGAGLKQARCEACGIDDWNGRPLELHLHHVNGRGNDNRLENLQLLCPNCHSQTPNYGGRNRGARAS